MEYQRLQKLTHRNMLKLIDSELKLAATMTDMAETEAQLGDSEHAKILLGRVERAIQSVRRYMDDHLLSDEEKREIKDRLKGLTTQPGAEHEGKPRNRVGAKRLAR
jgi:hypothetical protein